MARDFKWKVMNPEAPTGDMVDFVIPGILYERAFKEDRIHYENLRSAKFVLDRPQRIFEGVRDFNQGGWCFTARPVEWYIRESIVTPFPKHLVYAVYVNPRRFVYEWRAEKADPEDDLSPIEWRKRYKALLWKRTF